MTDTLFPAGAGFAREDKGPVMGSEGWYAFAVFILIGGGILGGAMFFGDATTPEQKKLGLAIFAVTALPLTGSIVQVVRLRRAIGTAKLFLPHDQLPLGFSGTATYLRPLREGVRVSAIETRLQCEEKLVKGSGKSRKVFKAVVYDETANAMVSPMSSQIRVQIPFRVPDSGPASFNKSNGNATITWMLRLHLQMEGCPNTRSSFEIDVLPAVVKS